MVELTRHLLDQGFDLSGTDGRLATVRIPLILVDRFVAYRPGILIVQDSMQLRIDNC